MGFNRSLSDSEDPCRNTMSLLVQPSPELQIHIRKELNEDVNTRDSDLQAIKDWLQKQPHLPDTWGKAEAKITKLE
jgi:hypothetical protein